ncbi:MAG: TetR family transcriptional regulator [Gordonia sp.]|nr:TetR family transcriptional regulator [Gordonia sp. (in: high G+C Gram-positive bacteria)]
MKAETPPDDKTPAGRPRDRGIDEAILRATAELLVSVGYAALTLAAVAQRAGTTKTALYRRWSSKAQLVHEAAFPAPVTTLIPESGDLTTDIRALIAGSRSIFTNPVTRAALPGLLGEVGADPVLNKLVMQRFQDGVFAAMRLRLHRAVERGEVRAGIDPDRLLEVIGGTTILRLLLRPDEDLDDDWVEQTTTIVLHGIAGHPDSTHAGG